jgi:malate synthase
MIKRFRRRADFVLADRQLITMETSFLKSYALLVIQTAHLRGTHALGGLSAEIPIKNDPAANNVALSRVLQEKLHEVGLGHDGTGVAHPGLVELARSAFDRVVAGPNQIRILRPDIDSRALDLLTVPHGNPSESAFHESISVALWYLEAWLRGVGSVTISNQQEHVSTAEICRAQLWQWVRYRKEFPFRRFARLLEEELENALATLGSGYQADVQAEKLKIAGELLSDVVSDDEFVEFITLPAYSRLESENASAGATSSDRPGVRVNPSWARRFLQIGRGKRAGGS